MAEAVSVGLGVAVLFLWTRLLEAKQVTLPVRPRDAAAGLLALSVLWAVIPWRLNAVVPIAIGLGAAAASSAAKAPTRFDKQLDDFHFRSAAAGPLVLAALAALSIAFGTPAWVGLALSALTGMSFLSAGSVLEFHAAALAAVDEHKSLTTALKATFDADLRDFESALTRMEQAWAVEKSEMRDRIAELTAEVQEARREAAAETTRAGEYRYLGQLEVNEIKKAHAIEWAKRDLADLTPEERATFRREIAEELERCRNVYRNKYSLYILASRLSRSKEHVLAALQEMEEDGEVAIALADNRRHLWAEVVAMTDEGRKALRDADQRVSAGAVTFNLSGDGNVVTLGGVALVSNRIVKGLPGGESAKPELEHALEEVSKQLELLTPGGVSQELATDLDAAAKEVKSATDAPMLGVGMRAMRRIAKELGEIGLPLMQAAEKVLGIVDRLGPGAQ